MDNNKWIRQFKSKNIKIEASREYSHLQDYVILTKSFVFNIFRFLKLSCSLVTYKNVLETIPWLSKFI